MRIQVSLKGKLAKVFDDYKVMYESEYFNLTIAEDMSEGIKVAGLPTV